LRPSAAIDVSIVVVSYNTRALTLACLDSIRFETRVARYELHVVDNASTDGSAAALAARSDIQHLTLSAENIGFARANNLASRSARGDLILLINPDTIVLDGAIDRLASFARAHPEAGIWGGRTRFADGRLNPSSCWGRMTPWNLLCRATGLTGLFPGVSLFNGETYGGWQRDSIAPVDIVSGCFLMIRRSLWECLGGFDPAFFMYGEEADLCLRAAHVGALPMISPEATIVHLGGASERTRAAKMQKLLTAKCTLIRRHWRPRLQPLGLMLMACWPLSRWLALSTSCWIKPSPARTEAAATWHEIWASRASWLVGYDQHAPHRPVAAAVPVIAQASVSAPMPAPARAAAFSSTGR
jgi:N-acetylglucosaminyl-diphospho-decaprenol L-rhamnosyltransferase